MQVSALTFMITAISTGVGVVAAMFGFGVFGSRLDRRFAQIDTRLDRVVQAAKPSAPDTEDGSPGNS